MSKEYRYWVHSRVDNLYWIQVGKYMYNIESIEIDDRKALASYTDYYLQHAYLIYLLKCGGIAVYE